MKNIFYLLTLSFFVSILFSCNPECENFSRIEATVMPMFDQGQKQLLITLNLPNFLDDRVLYTEKAINGELVINESTRVNTTPSNGGYLVNVSDVGEGNYNFYVIDNDCGGFIPINATFECSSIQGVLANITPSIRKAGNEILVTTTPSNFLTDRDIFIQIGNDPIDANNPVESRFVAGLGGRVAKVPANATGNANVYVEDRDCGGFIPISTLRVADQAFQAANPGLFVTPTPPNIVISPPNITPPTNVINTWFSPDNRDYCIWFLPELERVAETSGICFREGSNLLPGNDVTKLLDALGTGAFDRPESVDFAAIGSWELNAGCTGIDGGNYAANPVSGIINKTTGAVSFIIDRSSKGLGVEHYEGNIVEPSSLPDYAKYGGVCSEDRSKSPKAYMLVTSQETGQQMILFREFVFGLAESNLCK